MPICQDCGKEFQLTDTPTCSYEVGYIDGYNTLIKKKFPVNRLNRKGIIMGEYKTPKAIKDIQNLLDKIQDDYPHEKSKK
jgi:hypothetical protein